MSFERRDRISVFGALRPREGQSVTRAVVATYSLDLVAMLGLVLALGHESDADYETSPLGLAQAFDQMRGRLVVLHQLGRIIAPGAHRSVLPLLDTMVRAIPANERTASWHPKVALVRYEGGGKVEWRFWIGSRNLTGSTDLDAGLLLVSAEAKVWKPVADVAHLAEDLLSEAELSQGHLAELKAARWRTPLGIAVRRLAWRRPGEARRFIDAPLIAQAARACAVSPFINREGLAEVMKAGSKAVTLLTTERAASTVTPHPGVTFRIDTPPDPESSVSVAEQQDEAVGDFIEPPAAGIHAKLLMVTKRDRTLLMLGSANLTGRGLVGPNAEAVAFLDITDPVIADTLFALAEGGLELESVAVDDEVVEQERAERELDALISRFLAIPLKLAYAPDGPVLTVGVASDPVLAEASFEAAPFLAPEAWTRMRMGEGTVRLAEHPPPLSEQTALVSFRARSLRPPEAARTWVQAVEIEGFEAARRDRELLARYLGAHRFRAWLKSLLDGVDTTSGQRWSDALNRVGYLDASVGLPEAFTLETMLAAWARDRTSFETRIAGMIDMLEAFEEVFLSLPDEEERAAALADLNEVRPFLVALADAVAAPR